MVHIDMLAMCMSGKEFFMELQYVNMAVRLVVMYDPVSWLWTFWWLDDG
jgi:hypothetical protein